MEMYPDDDPDLMTTPKGGSRLCDETYLRSLLSLYEREIAALERKLKIDALWQSNKQKQLSRQNRLAHLQQRCLPFVTKRINKLEEWDRRDFFACNRL